MSYKINRLEKSADSQGNDELFLEMTIIDDDIGCYNYGAWLSEDDFELLKEDYGEGFDACRKYSDFRKLKASTVLTDVIESHLPIARQRRKDTIAAEARDAAKAAN